MAITSFDNYIAAAKQVVNINKSAARTTVAGIWYNAFDLAGDPGAGTAAGTSTTAGVVPTDTTQGFPLINTFGGGNTGYLTRVMMGSSVACRIMLYDMLWKAGAFNFNSSTSGNTSGSWSGRVPSGTDYTNTELWVEALSVSITGNLSVAVTYSDQSGNTGHSTGTFATGLTGNLAGRLVQLPLAAGDSGVSAVSGVVGSVASGGTACFNILVLRPLLTLRIPVINSAVLAGPDITGFIQLFATSALGIAVATDSTAIGVPELDVEIANG